MARPCNAEIASKLFLKQSVAVAIVIKLSHTPQLKAGLGITLGIKLHQLNPIGCDERYK